jgi:starch synthase
MAKKPTKKTTQKPAAAKTAKPTAASGAKLETTAPKAAPDPVTKPTGKGPVAAKPSSPGSSTNKPQPNPTKAPATTGARPASAQKKAAQARPSSDAPVRAGKAQESDRGVRTPDTEHEPAASSKTTPATVKPGEKATERPTGAGSAATGAGSDSKPGGAQTTAATPTRSPAGIAPKVVPAAAPKPVPQPPSAEDAGEKPDTAPVTPPEPHPEPPPVHHPPRPSLFIVQITPEMAPVAKIGGLADVVFGLSRELAIRGNHVEIILPKYDNLRYDHIYNLDPVYNDLWVPWFDGAIHCTVYFGFVHDRKCFFIEPHSQDNFFNRGSIYGFADDVLRYAFFSRAAIEYLWQSGKHPDIIHCHDWQTALVPVFLYEFYQQLGMTHPRVCLTIHNFKHQGVTGPELLRATGLNHPERFLDWLRLGDNHHKGAINLLKGGVVYSNFVTTVSPRYAFETKDQGQGFGLEPTLHTHHMKYGGVVNGIDYDVWNPEVDGYIPARYGVDSIDTKYENKRALRHRLMLADNEKPIVAFIGRLDPQKGLDLVRHAIFATLERGAQFVLLGSSPDQAINNDFWGLKHMLNDSPDCHLEIGFDEELSHLIYAGADIMLVPSQFEPCGLTQLIALRYGTVPVVRTVGGLADTVFDKDHSDRPLHQRNGYRFDNYDVPGLESALIRALDCYYQYPEHFRELIRNAMRTDYSWNHPGQDYLNIYDFIRNR